MNAFILLPIIVLRYLVLGLLNKASLKRAAFFPARIGREKVAYWLYQLSGFALLIYAFFIEIKPAVPSFYAGAVMYLFGAIIYVFAIYGYVRSSDSGMSSKGIYRWSRNPMYAGYFFFFFGVGVMTLSYIWLVLLFVFQISAHWIILSEERWCIQQFGEEYIAYMKKVHRYL